MGRFSPSGFEVAKEQGKSQETRNVLSALLYDNKLTKTQKDAQGSISLRRVRNRSKVGERIQGLIHNPQGLISMWFVQANQHNNTKQII
jgi:hypothetical protein